MNNTQYRNAVMGALNEIADNTKLNQAIHEGLSAGTARRRQRRRRQQGWEAAVSKTNSANQMRFNGECTCGQPHLAIELFRAGEPLETLCPRAYYLRRLWWIMDKYGGKALMDFAKKHPMRNFIKIPKEEK